MLPSGGWARRAVYNGLVRSQEGGGVKTLNAPRLVRFSMAVGVVAIVASCSSGYYYGIEQEVDDFDRGAYETARRESDERWATEEADDANYRTAEAEIWADQVATENAFRIRDGRPTLTP